MSPDTERDLKVAAAVQQSLLPAAYRAGAFFTTAGTVNPCREIGGDFFDYVDLRGGHFGFLFGDASGKGPAAALVASTVLGMFSAEARYHSGPAAILTRLNDDILQRHMDARFVTTFYAVLSPQGLLTYANGGHNAPILLTRNTVRRLDAGGPALGLFRNVTFEEETLPLEPGDCVVTFSDGIVEALNESGDEFTEDRLINCVEARRGDDPAAIVRAVFDAVLAFCGGVTPGDDMTVVVTRYDGRASARSGPWAPEDLSTSRRHYR